MRFLFLTFGAFCAVLVLRYGFGDGEESLAESSVPMISIPSAGQEFIVEEPEAPEVDQDSDPVAASRVMQDVSPQDPLLTESPAGVATLSGAGGESAAIIIGEKVDPDSAHQRAFLGSQDAIRIGARVDPEDPAMMAMRGSIDEILIGERVEYGGESQVIRSGVEAPVMIGEHVEPGNQAGRQSGGSNQPILIGERLEVKIR